jgi:G3E family GTPase
VTERVDRRRLPVLVVSGFLGSGKTTLLRKVLTGEKMARSLVLVNEAAEIGVDDRVLRTRGGQTVRLLGNGCLCCAIEEDLRRVLLDVVDDPAVLGGIDRIVIETSGLADPVSAIATLAAHPRLACVLRLQAVVTVVDVLQAAEQLRDFAEFASQVESADVLVLSKADLASSDALEQAWRRLESMNPLASSHDARSPDIGRDLADAGSRFLSDRAVRQWSFEPQRDAAGKVHHTTGVEAFGIRIRKPIDWIGFTTWFSLLLHAHGRDLLRVKGIVSFDDGVSPVLVNSVRHVVHPPEHLPEWPDEDRSMFLVFVVRDLRPQDVLRSMERFLGTAPDDCTLVSPRIRSSATATTIARSGG